MEALVSAVIAMVAGGAALNNRLHNRINNVHDRISGLDRRIDALELKKTSLTNCITLLQRSFLPVLNQVRLLHKI